jgi:hypothetical protein
MKKIISDVPLGLELAAEHMHSPGFLLGTIRAAAIGGRGKLGQGHPLNFSHLAQDGQQARVVEPVMHESPLAARLQQVGFAQSHQVLGKGCLAYAKHGLEMAYTGFAITDGQQDLQAGFLPDGLEQGSHRLD